MKIINRMLLTVLQDTHVFRDCCFCFQFEIKERKRQEEHESPEDILRAKEEKLQRLIAEFMPPPKPYVPNSVSVSNLGRGRPLLNSF